MLAILTAYNNHAPLSLDDAQITIEKVYNDLVDTYILTPIENRAECSTVFAMCLKLALSTPRTGRLHCCAFM